MHQITSVGMEFDVLKANAETAHENYDMLKEHNIVSIDFMGSIGAGKTAMIIKLAEKLRAKGKKVYAIAGDVTGKDDFTRMENSGIKAVNCNTGKDCHLTANMIHKKLHEMDLSDVDVLFIENVGNLVCPASFDLGEKRRIVLLSVTEGEDKPLKYPVIFREADLVLITKNDLAAAVEFDRTAAEANIQQVAPKAQILSLSSKTGEGVEDWLRWIAAQA